MNLCFRAWVKGGALIASSGLALAGALTASRLAAQAATSAPGVDSAYFRSDWGAALAGYTKLVRQDSANPVAWFRIGVAQHGLGHFELALGAYSNARRFGFQPLAVNLRAARAYARLGDSKRALEFADSAVQLGGGWPPATFADEPDFAGIRDLAPFQAMRKRIEDARYPCNANPEAHDFDFWIGEWDVSSWNQPIALRGAAGFNDVRVDLQHSVILDNWTGSGGGKGKSFNLFDTNIHKWRQLWMADGGGTLDYTGSYRDGAMRFEGWTAAPDGSHILQKLTFTPCGTDTVRQTFEISRDSAKTWAVTFDGRYIRRGH